MTLLPLIKGSDVFYQELKDIKAIRFGSVAQNSFLFKLVGIADGEAEVVRSEKERGKVVFLMGIQNSWL
jgi:hypothetical protein